MRKSKVWKDCQMIVAQISKIRGANMVTQIRTDSNIHRYITVKCKSNTEKNDYVI